jgi:hypothetical protein
VTIDPHKGFFQAYDVGALVVRDGRHLRDTFDRSPEYYRGGETAVDTDDDAADHGGDAHAAGQLNFYKLGFEGTRRFRALKLWASWHHLGTTGLGRLGEADLDVGYLARCCADADDLEALRRPELSVVCFRHLAAGCRARRRRTTSTLTRTAWLPSSSDRARLAVDDARDPMATRRIELPRPRPTSTACRDPAARPDARSARSTPPRGEPISPSSTARQRQEPCPPSYGAGPVGTTATRSRAARRRRPTPRPHPEPGHDRDPGPATAGRASPVDASVDHAVVRERDPPPHAYSTGALPSCGWTPAIARCRIAAALATEVGHAARPPNSIRLSGVAPVPEEALVEEQPPARADSGEVRGSGAVTMMKLWIAMIRRRSDG